MSNGGIRQYTDATGLTFKKNGFDSHNFFLNLKTQSFEIDFWKITKYVQCGDASHHIFKGSTEISYIETP